LTHDRSFFIFDRMLDSAPLPTSLEQAPWKRMVVVGDSVAAGVREPLDGYRDLGFADQVVEPLAGAGAFVVTVGLFDLARSGLLPPEVAPLMIARFDELDAITADVVAGVGGLHVDTHHHPRAADPAIYASDHIHANALGHAIAFSAVVDSLGAWLSR
jgi:lysophospholipase L1-like esterase